MLALLLAQQVPRSAQFVHSAQAASPPSPSYLPPPSILSYVERLPNGLHVILDARPGRICETASLPGARCLPATDFLGPHKGLANFSGLLWLLGTIGLTGAEHVLIVGDRRRDRDFVAGLLYLLGQQQISVLRPRLTALISKTRDGARFPSGEPRSKTREQVFQAALRDQVLVLRADLKAMLKDGTMPLLLDGRREAEYWGREIRTARGGHLPGAQHLAMSSLRAANPRTARTSLESALIMKDQPAIAYGHNSYEGLIYLARLVAAGLPARLYLEGWTGWALDGALPVDNVSYFDRRRSARPKRTGSLLGANAKLGDARPVAAPAGPAHITMTATNNAQIARRAAPTSIGTIALRLALIVLASLALFGAGWAAHRLIKT